VSNALRKLRVKYDTVSKLVHQKEFTLDMIKKGVEKIAREEHNVEYETSGMNIGTEQAKAELIDITERHNFE